MLKSLYIKNYALIDSLEIDFNRGFSVITGETGAGKSIILGALGLILGQRADAKSIKQDESKCIIEGIFDISAYDDLKQVFEELGIDYDINCILRRELLSTGKSRAFVNDTPVTLNDLKEIGGKLIDIHSQHQNLLLNDDRFQLYVVDVLAGNKLLLEEYKNVYKDFKQTEKRLADLKDAIRRNKEEEDYFRFQYQVLHEAALIDGEQEDMESEHEMLTHAEDIKSALYRIHTLLSDDERGIVQQLKECLGTTHSIEKVFTKSDDIKLRLDAAYIDLKDLASEIERDANDVEFNPERLSFVQSRLDTIYSLQKKHTVTTIAELIALHKELEAKIAAMDSSDQKIEELEKELESKSEKMLILAKRLSDSRLLVSEKIEKELSSRLTYLGMPNVRIRCEVLAKDQPDISGMDDVIFLFSANKNSELQPVANVASGGEISRLMLCLKSMIANATALPTIIFDEIDTGVSGEIADKMGQIMDEFGQNIQVITITHLPQIAAKGKTHYRVYKTDTDTSTITNLRKLTDNERLEEVARMLSGATLTDAAIQNAKTMLGL